MHKVIKLAQVKALGAIILIGLAGCSARVAKEQLTPGILPPVVNPVTEMNQTLRDLPKPSRKVAVAVYDYADQTGQFKPTEAAQTLSRAVTQGATSILIKALQDVGGGSWFTVVEREKIANLLKERRIITQMRMAYLGEKKINPKALPPLLFAAVIFEGGIIGYDSNIQTGGIGARLLGIGGDVKYQLDTITVYLRAVSTKTGEVLASVTTHKTIASIGIQGGAFKFIAVDKILEAEAGITKNEPDQLAVQQAIEKAVYSMVIEGTDKQIWSFADKAAQASLIDAYKADLRPESAQAEDRDVVRSIPVSDGRESGQRGAPNKKVADDSSQSSEAIAMAVLQEFPSNSTGRARKTPTAMVDTPPSMPEKARTAPLDRPSPQGRETASAEATAVSDTAQDGTATIALPARASASFATRVEILPAERSNTRHRWQTSTVMASRYRSVTNIPPPSRKARGTGQRSDSGEDHHPASNPWATDVATVRETFNNQPSSHYRESVSEQRAAYSCKKIFYNRFLFHSGGEKRRVLKDYL